MMKEIKTILEAYDQIKGSGKRSALATVIRVDGSSYRRSGARMLVTEDGQWTGGISGGCLEGDALRRAQLAILQNSPSIITYDTRDDDAQQIGVGLGCHGVLDILITPIHEDRQGHPLQVLSDIAGAREEQLLLTITASPDDHLPIGQVIHFTDEQRLLAEAKVTAALLPTIQEAERKRKSSHVTVETAEGPLSCFVEFLPPPLHIIVQGDNYDIYPLLRLARELGCTLSLVAKPRKLDRSAWQLADKIYATGSSERPAVDPYTATVLMAHDYATDLLHLRQMLATDIPYIGLLGPKKRFHKLLNTLREQGSEVTADDARLHAPIGLDLGATSPEEIALSMLAEIKAFFSSADGKPLRHRSGPIHQREIKA